MSGPGPGAGVPDRAGAGRDPSVTELRAAATHAANRLALYRRRMYIGRGDPRRLAELERVSTGAADRLRRASKRATTTPDPKPEAPR